MRFSNEQRREPLIGSPLPGRPWEKVGVELFDLEGVPYLVVVDYYSRYPEVKQLTRTRSLDVILVMQGIFARHGIPNLVISDNGPQFSSEEFKEFSKRYQFSHQTSSPRHPQANGLVERTVGIVKSILKKAKQANEDPHLALLAYRTTGHEVTGVSPGQLLMGRRLRTTPSQKQPQLVDDNLIRHRHDLCKTQQAQYYNQRHGVSLLPELELGG